ncbi:MAG: hypothetical protein JJE17_12825 [Peptostreptococcaceae bacterium]|nr:hypothetical protein [Peptostreptococcaceae bacterium]
MKTRKPNFINGELVYKIPSLDETRTCCAEQVASLWEEMLRFENPQIYYVDLSKELWEMKSKLLEVSPL